MHCTGEQGLALVIFSHLLPFLSAAGARFRAPKQQDIELSLGKPARCGEPGQELDSDVSGEGEGCVCQKYFLLWPDNGRCYQEFTQGPCKEGYRFIWDPSIQTAVCSCPVFWARYGDGKCYEEYTKGPCPIGTVIMKNDSTEEGFCGCSSSLQMYFHQETNSCYELYSRGPCPRGHILSFNYTTLQPECKCHPNYHFNLADGACYELNTEGPCGDMDHCDQGTPCFMRSSDTLQTGCRCLPKNSLTKEGKCFQPYTRGPCRFGEWFVFNGQETGKCEEKKYCKRFDNWHWWAPDQRCYRQFTQGPCEQGKLFYLDSEAGGSGCHCRRDWAAYYWEPLDQCFEQESRGPCKEGQYFAYNRTTHSTECSCFKNHVYSPATESCVELYTRGPCQYGEVVVPDPRSGELSCSCGPQLTRHYWPPARACFPLYERGPCREGQQFRIQPDTNLPACVVWGGQK